MIYEAMNLKYRIFITDYQSIMKENKNFEVHYKSGDLTSILSESFGKSMSLARIKFVSLAICAFCKFQTAESIVAVQ